MPTQYDHQLSINGTISRYSLVRDDDGRAMYSVSEGYGDTPSRLVFQQSNWIGGHGQIVFKNPNMYMEGQSIDTTLDGKVFLGPEITEVKESDATNLDSAVKGFDWSEANSRWLCWTSGQIYLFGTAWTAASTTVGSVEQITEFDAVLYA